MSIFGDIEPITTRPLGRPECVEHGPECIGHAIRRPMPTYGLCTACGAVEVELVKANGARDLSHTGESSTYPTGYGCECCA